MQCMLKRVDAVFDIEGFSTSPACIIILELFQAKARGGALSITSLVDTMSCPESVTYRWVDILEARQLLEKFSGAHGGLRVGLTEKGYLKAAEALQLLL